MSSKWLGGSRMSPFPLAILTVFLTLAFEFSNGWHDAANSIAAVVSTRVLTPFRAVLWASFWNFVAAFVFGTAVANTVGKGLIHLEVVNTQVLLAGLLGAITWNLITLVLGLPTSSSHALMGGYGAQPSLSPVSKHLFCPAGSCQCCSSSARRFLA